MSKNVRIKDLEMEASVHFSKRDFAKAVQAYEALYHEQRSKDVISNETLLGLGFSLILDKKIHRGVDKCVSAYYNDISNQDGRNWKYVFKRPAFTLLSCSLAVPPTILFHSFDDEKTLRDECLRHIVQANKTRCRPWQSEIEVEDYLMEFKYSDAKSRIENSINCLLGMKKDWNERIHLGRIFYSKAITQMYQNEWRDVVESLIISLVEDAITLSDRDNPLDYSAYKALRRHFRATPGFLKKIADDAVSEWRMVESDYSKIRTVYEKILRKYKEGIDLKADDRRNAKEILDEADSVGNRLRAVSESVEENRANLNGYLGESQLRGENGRNPPASKLIILKRWNSITPVFPGRPFPGLGGGYYILWRGKGIAVDPGYGFLSQLYDKGYTMNDIDLILVTHAHDDHTAQLESIFSLKYKVSQQFPHLARKADLIASEGSMIKYSQLLKNTDCRCEVATSSTSPDDIDWMESDYFSTLQGIPTVHHEKPWMINNTGVGFILNLIGEDSSIFKLGITSDTKYYPELSPVFRDIDLLIVHIGTINDPESKHLQLEGAARVIRESRPKLAILSEFGEELRGSRCDLADIIKSIVERNQHPPFSNRICNIIPGDSGLVILLPDLDVEINGQAIRPGQLECSEDQDLDEIHYESA